MSKKNKKLTDEERLERLELLVDSIIESAEDTPDLEQKGTAARAAIAVMAELRKAQAAARKASEETTTESVLAAFRSLTARERSAVTGEIERMSAGKSSLA